MTESLTISSIIPNSLLSELTKYRFSTEQLSKQGVALDFLQCEPDARINLNDYLKLEKLANELTGDKGFFLDFGKSLDPLPDSVKYVVLHSADTKERINNVLRYMKLLCEAFNMHLEENPESAEITFSITPVRYYSIYTIEMIMANIMCGLRSGYDEAYKPLQVCFQHSPPLYRRYYDDFFGIPVSFEQSSNCILFDKEILSIKHSDQAYLKDIFVRHADGLLDKLTDSSKFSSTVRNIIVEKLPSSNLSIRLLESYLNMTRQTIHRKLKEENTTYEALLYEIRKQKAIEYLKDKKLSIEEISFLLGYSETSAFYHAFKKWFNKSPSEYRSSLF
jgi:AraC-like DNA-binding protein